MAISITTFYKIDGKDTIISVGGAWDSFAQENNGSNATAEKVVGQQIWNYISGAPTVMWLKSIFGYVRLHEKSIERNYRCDSPGKIREMRMLVKPEPDRGLLLEHEILSTTERDEPVCFSGSAGPKSDNLILMCSMCNQIRFDGHWREPGKIDRVTLKKIAVGWSVCEKCKLLLPNISG